MIEAQHLLAANPETDPEILRELSQSDDRSIRQAVAGNPNVPIDILWKLHQEFPHDLLENPAFINLTVASQLALANNPETNPENLRELSYHTDPQIAEAVARNPNTPIDVLKFLINHYPYAVQENSLLPIILLEDPYWLYHALRQGELDDLKDAPEVFIAIAKGDCPCQRCNSNDYNYNEGWF